MNAPKELAGILVPSSFLNPRQSIIPSFLFMRWLQGLCGHNKSDCIQTTTSSFGITFLKS